MFSESMYYVYKSWGSRQFHVTFQLRLIDLFSRRDNSIFNTWNTLQINIQYLFLYILQIYNIALLFFLNIQYNTDIFYISQIYRIIQIFYIFHKYTIIENRIYREEFNGKKCKRPFCCTVSILQVYFTYLCYMGEWGGVGGRSLLALDQLSIYFCMGGEALYHAGYFLQG